MLARGLPVEPEFDYRDDSALKRHPDYRAAKEGDKGAAVRLVRDLVTPESLDASRKLGPGVLFVPVHAEEASGRNKIPAMLALAHAQAAGARVVSEIVQTNHAFHTGAGPMERIMNRAEFTGKVEPGQCYVLVDDVTTMGSTLADLAGYIRRNGGEVEGARLLVNAARGVKIAPEPKIIKELEARHGQALREIIHIDAGQLTGPESQYLIGFRTTDELRNRVAKAGLERDARLRSKILSGRSPGVGAVREEPTKSEARLDQAVKTAITSIQRTAASRGQTFNAENLQQMEKMVRERFERDPKAVQKVLQKAQQAERPVAIKEPPQKQRDGPER